MCQLAKNMKHEHHRRLKKSLRLELCVNWIFGLGVIEYPIGTYWPKLSTFHTILCLAAYGLLSYSTVLLFDEKRTMIEAAPLESDTEFYICNLMVIVTTVFACIRNKASRK